MDFSKWHRKPSCALQQRGHLHLLCNTIELLRHAKRLALGNYANKDVLEMVQIAHGYFVHGNDETLVHKISVLAPFQRPLANLVPVFWQYVALATHSGRTKRSKVHQNRNSWGAQKSTD